VLLVRLPTLLGGDVPHGEHMLERVLREDQTCITARLTLAELYAERGARTDAVALAAQARELARASGRADKVAKAEGELTKLNATPAKSPPASPSRRVPPARNELPAKIRPRRRSLKDASFRPITGGRCRLPYVFRCGHASRLQHEIVA
jgi:hypothetical protein